MLRMLRRRGLSLLGIFWLLRRLFVKQLLFNFACGEDEDVGTAEDTGFYVRVLLGSFDEGIRLHPAHD